jgi:hypothetical protein
MGQEQALCGCWRFSWAADFRLGEMGVIGEQVVSIALNTFTPLFAIVRHCSIFCTVCFDPGLLSRESMLTTLAV